jgi:hypothetical protein
VATELTETSFVCWLLYKVGEVGNGSPCMHFLPTTSTSRASGYAVATYRRIKLPNSGRLFPSVLLTAVHLPSDAAWRIRQVQVADRPLEWRLYGGHERQQLAGSGNTRSARTPQTVVENRIPVDDANPA